MTKTEILKGLRARCTAEFITAGQAAILLGRSVNEARSLVFGLQSIPSGGEGKQKLYFIGDIAERCVELRDGLKLESSNLKVAQPQSPPPAQTG